MVASPLAVESSRRLALLRRSPSFGYLFLATAGSTFGTYLAAVALTVDVYDETGSGRWVAALLLANILPIVLIGLFLGPLVDRLSRRRLMIASDLVRLAVFAALPFVEAAEGVIALAAIAGVATGFFLPAVYAGLPNLVDEEDLTNANSLLQTVETLAWMLGPVVGGVLLAVWGPAVPYVVNAGTFLLSALLVARIPEAELRSDEPLTQGHWRDVADGIKLVVISAPLRAVLVTWSVVALGAAAVSVAEVIFAKNDLDSGNIGFGFLVAASGLGLALGSFFSAPALGKVGLRRHYVGSITLMGVGWGAAALSGTIWLAVPLVVAGAVGNGGATVCNRLFIQRAAPDRYRGRALATIMSSTYAVTGLGMAAAGALADVFGARAIWMGASAVFLVGALVALVVTSWLPVASDAEQQAIEASSVSAVAALGDGREQPLEQGPEQTPAREPTPVLEPSALEPEPAPSANGQHSSLERLAVLMEEIEGARDAEARRPS